MVAGWCVAVPELRAPSLRETGVSAWRRGRGGCVVGSARRILECERWSRPETPVSRRACCWLAAWCGFWAPGGACVALREGLVG